MKYTRTGNMIQATTCPVCAGQDQRTWELCPTCVGRGGVADTTSVKFNVPPGTSDASIFRFQGCGNWVPVEQAHGDGYIRFTVIQHDDFTRAGDDIVCTRILDYKDLLLGYSLHVDVFGTEVTVNVPPLSAAGDQVTVPDRGFRGGDMRVLLQMSRDIPVSELEILEKIRKGQEVVIVN